MPKYYVIVNYARNKYLFFCVLRIFTTHLLIMQVNLRVNKREWFYGSSCFTTYIRDTHKKSCNRSFLQ
jgi:hypothetical protein